MGFALLKSWMADKLCKICSSYSDLNKVLSCCFEIKISVLLLFYANTIFHRKAALCSHWDFISVVLAHRSSFMRTPNFRQLLWLICILCGFQTKSVEEPRISMWCYFKEYSLTFIWALVNVCRLSHYSTFVSFLPHLDLSVTAIFHLVLQTQSQKRRPSRWSCERQRMGTVLLPMRTLEIKDQRAEI